MNYKKIAFDTLVILFAFFIFITWYHYKFNNYSVHAAAIKDKKIYLITKDKTGQFWYTLNMGVADMAKLWGVDYIWDAPQIQNTEEQIQMLNSAVQNGAEAILIASNDPVELSYPIAQAKEKGVKIIYVDDPANEKAITTLATDNYAAGITAGTNMLSELESNGIKNGSIGILAVTPENASTINREKGFRDTISADGRFQLLETKYAGGVFELEKAAAEEYIAKTSDLVGLFATNETSTEAAGNAIKNNNKNIIGIGFDLTDTIQQLINEGYLKAVMVQNPYTMGYLGMAEALAALSGFDTGPSYINTGVSIKTQYSH